MALLKAGRRPVTEREDTSPSQMTAARTLPPGLVLSPDARLSAQRPWEVGTGTPVPILQTETCRAGRAARDAAVQLRGQAEDMSSMPRLVLAGNACAPVCVCVHRRCVPCVCLRSSYLYPVVGCAKSIVLNYARCNLDGDTMQLALAMLRGIYSI